MAERSSGPVVDFNLSPAGYVHDSWYDVLPHGKSASAMAAYARCRRHVSRYILQATGLENRYFVEFDEPRARLALLPPAVLETLFLYVGVTLRHKEFANELDGKKIALWRRDLGEGALGYATSRVQFSGAVPEFDFEPQDLDSPRLRLMAIGMVYSLSPRAAASAAYLDRVALMLPERLAAPVKAGLPDGAAEPDTTDLPTVARRVVKEFVPQWQDLQV